MNKEQLRKDALNSRKRLSDEVFHRRNKEVSEQAIKLIQGTDARTVHLFLPISKNREVDTWPIYNHLIKSAQHIPVVSKTHFKKNTLSHHPMKAGDELIESSYGIPEPIHDLTIEPSKIDLVLVPLLAFDSQGNRVGYGAGFYDRFLAKCNPDILKVGLVMNAPTDELIETNPFDIPLDLCINHERIYDFRIITG